MNDRFVPMYDLDRLTEEQRLEYYRSACEYYGVPAEMNMLAFLYMDNGDGARNLVLYAKKGATDHIRDDRGITTIELVGPSTVGGSVVFTAVGKDKKDRVERAVGAASIEGLHGQHLAAAIMTAQTRATRRMTLQFVGGLLDESEVHNTTTNIATAGESLAKIAAQPAVKPNNSAGEVKPVQTTEPIVQASEAQKAALEALSKVDKGKLAEAAGEPVQQAASPSEEPVKRRTKTRKSAVADIPESQQSTLQSIVDISKTFTDVAPIAVTGALAEPALSIADKVKEILTQPLGMPMDEAKKMIASMEAKPVEPPAPPVASGILPTADQQKAYRAKTRKSANVNIPESQPLATCISPECEATKAPDSASGLCDMHLSQTGFTVGDGPVPAGTPVTAVVGIQLEAKPVEPPAPAVASGALPTADQQKAYRARWSEYVNKRLSKEGGMVPTEGIGGVSTKLRKFVNYILDGVPPGEHLTVDQWETILEYLDSKYETLGAAELVKFIDGMVCK